MENARIIAQMLLGLMFVGAGLNGFQPFIPKTLPSGLAGAFLGAMFQSGYLQAISVFQIVGGALLLTRRFAALGLTLLGPVIVNILLFHLFLERTGLPIAIVVSCLALFLLWAYRERFAPILKA